MLSTNAGSPIGYLVHRSSQKLIHPRGGSPNPPINTPLAIHSGGLGEKRLAFCFQEIAGTGGFGLLQHVSSGQYVHPFGGSVHPHDDTLVVLHPNFHYACLFKFDSQNDYIIHVGGKSWHPADGNPHAAEGTLVDLYGTSRGGATFYLANENGVKLSPCS